MKHKGLFSLFSLFFFPILLFGFALGLLFLPLPDLFPPVGSSERSLMTAIITGLLGLIWLVFLVVQLIRIVFIPGRMLDRIFISKGFIRKKLSWCGQTVSGLPRRSPGIH